VKSGRLVQSAAEHHELVDLVEARDAAGAEQLMLRHIGHVRGLWARKESAEETAQGR
jgi:DNA-binding GntR family transcriptional regulator